VKLVALLLLTAGLAMPYDREGNYTIRFEPMAVLQSGVPIPFHIKVEDGRHQVLNDAKVTMQIETPEHKDVQLFKAAAIGAGIYSAKPVFPSAGEWLVMVDVRRDDQVSARIIRFEVANPQN
jgi:hypothetical protein